MRVLSENWCSVCFRSIRKICRKLKNLISIPCSEIGVSCTQVFFHSLIAHGESLTSFKEHRCSWEGWETLRWWRSITNLKSRDSVENRRSQLETQIHLIKCFAITVLINWIVTSLIDSVMAFSSQWSRTVTENCGLERSIVQPPTADKYFKASSLSHSMVPNTASSAGLSLGTYFSP
jgi:hypothetical protein